MTKLIFEPVHDGDGELVAIKVEEWTTPILVDNQLIAMANTRVMLIELGPDGKAIEFRAQGEVARYRAIIRAKDRDASWYELMSTRWAPWVGPIEPYEA